MDNETDITIAADCNQSPSIKYPEPLVPVGTVFKAKPWFALDSNWLLSSRMMVTGTPEEFRAQMALMAYSWQQSPPGSLPNSDTELAWMSRSRCWRKIKSKVLAEWVVCSDGRLYHPYLSEDAKRVIETQKANYNRTKPGRDAQAATRQAGTIVPFPKQTEPDEDIPF